jgi:hypothetical protein
MYLAAMAKRLPPHKVRRMNLEEGQGKMQSDDEERHIKAPVYVECDVYQAARLNMLLPKHLRLEQDFTVIKAMDQRKQNFANRKKLEEKNKKKEQRYEMERKRKEEKIMEREAQRQLQ